MISFTVSTIESIFPSRSEFKSTIEPHFNQVLVFSSLCLGAIVIVLVLRKLSGG
jgi:hypothetical protein